MKALVGARTRARRCCPARSPRSCSGSSPSTWCASAWIFFRADSVGTAFDVIGGIVTWAEPNELVTGADRRHVVLLIASQFVPPGRSSAGAGPLHRSSPPAPRPSCLAGALTVIDVLGPDGVAPFIYFQF